MQVEVAVLEGKVDIVIGRGIQVQHIVPDDHVILGVVPKNENPTKMTKSRPLFTKCLTIGRRCLLVRRGLGRA